MATVTGPVTQINAFELLAPKERRLGSLLESHKAPGIWLLEQPATIDKPTSATSVVSISYVIAFAWDLVHLKLCYTQAIRNKKILGETVHQAVQDVQLIPHRLVSTLPTLLHLPFQAPPAIDFCAARRKDVMD